MIIQEWHVGYAFNTGWNNTDSVFSHAVLMIAIMHAMLERKMSAGYLQVTMYSSKGFHLQFVSLIVGKFAGWLMYFPALPNCMSIFHSSTGGSNTMSLTLHDLVFPVA